MVNYLEQKLANIFVKGKTKCFRLCGIHICLCVMFFKQPFKYIKTILILSFQHTEHTELTLVLYKNSSWVRCSLCTLVCHCIFPQFSYCIVQRVMSSFKKYKRRLGTHLNCMLFTLLNRIGNSEFFIFCL